MARSKPSSSKLNQVLAYATLLLVLILATTAADASSVCLSQLPTIIQNYTRAHPRAYFGIAARELNVQKVCDLPKMNANNRVSNTSCFIFFRIFLN